MNSTMVQQRVLTKKHRNLFIVWTSFWWGGVVLMAALFFIGKLGFTESTRYSLYGISIWLNGTLLGLIGSGSDGRSKAQLYHDCMML